MERSLDGVRLRRQDHVHRLALVFLPDAGKKNSLFALGTIRYVCLLNPLACYS